MFVIALKRVCSVWRRCAVSHKDSLLFDCFHTAADPGSQHHGLYIFLSVFCHARKERSFVDVLQQEILAQLHVIALSWRSSPQRIRCETRDAHQPLKYVLFEEVSWKRLFYLSETFLEFDFSRFLLAFCCATFFHPVSDDGQPVKLLIFVWRSKCGMSGS